MPRSRDTSREAEEVQLSLYRAMTPARRSQISAELSISAHSIGSTRRSSSELTLLLRTIKSKLESAGIPYMVVGSCAGTFHGAPRTIRNLDIVIAPTPTSLDIELDPTRKIDLITRKNRAFSIGELDRRTVGEIFAVEVPVATAEDTIIAALEARQLTDVAGILGVRSDAIDRAYIETWIEGCTTALGLRDQWDRAQALRT